MKSAIFVASAVLMSFVAVSQSGVISEPLDDVMPYSIIDPIIKAILEGMRPKLANLKINDINETIRNPNLNASILVNDILIKNADKFVIKSLKSNVIPLKLTNLTLTWEEIIGTAAYNVNASIGNPKNNTPINIYGKGNAKVTLNGLYFTIGANMEMKDKAIQVKPKGFFGFDIKLNKANVTLSSLMGSTDLANAVSVFVSKMLPELIDTLKKPLFDAFHDDLVKIVNQILKKNGTSLFMDEEPQLPNFSFESLDLSEEIGQNLGIEWEDLRLENEF